MQNYKQNTNIYFYVGYFTQLMAYWKWEIYICRGNSWNPAIL